MKFADIIGQQDVKQMLRRSVAEGRVSHAQLFTGECGYGTLALALAYAQYINCTDRSEEDSCGRCPSCRQMETLVHPDLHFVFPVNSSKSGAQKPLSDAFLPQWRKTILETNGYFDEQMWYSAIEIDNQQGLIAKREADEVIRKLSFKSFESEYKIVLVWLPERMGEEAANSLLKILEEPWEKTLFLLVSLEEERLLPTILSRMQQVSVPAIDTASMEGYVMRQGISDAAHVRSLARLSVGNVLTVKRLLAPEHDRSTHEDFEAFVELMRLSYNDRHLELFEWADNMAALGREAQKRFLQNCVRLLRESYMISAGVEEISYLWAEERNFCAKFAPYVNNSNIEGLLAESEKLWAQIVQNGNGRILFAHYALAVSKMIVKKQ